jgi:hypothetical protein
VTYYNIPEELTQLNQWMVTTAGSKKPHSPNDIRVDSWNDPSSWGSFTDAVSAVKFGYAEHLGLVLRKENGIVAIDLDNKPDSPATEEQLLYHSHILRAFGASYTERSVSNTDDNPSYHIFVKGQIPRSVNKDHIELRCDNFIVVTGDVDGDVPKPILNGAECAKHLEGLAHFLGAYDQAIALVDDAPRRYETSYIVEKMLESKNSDYLRQPVGNSEIDYTIFSWIWESWTQNRVQALEVFDSFPYSQRNKSDGTKLTPYHKNHTLEKVINMLEAKKVSIDITKFVRPAPVVKEPAKAMAMPLEIPPQSLIEEIVQHGLRIAHKPSEHTALAGALALMGAICGRTYTTPTNGGTALFLFLIAATGAGKELSKQIVKELLFEMQKAGISTATDMAGFRLISGPGIHSMLHEQESRSTVLLESEGVAKLSMIAKKATPLHEELLQSILSLYSDNKPGGMLQRTGHATKEKKLGTVEFPAVSMLFEGVPEEFDKSLSEEMISTGLLARFLVIEKIGSTVRNFDADENHAPSPSLGNKLFALVNYSLQMQALKKTHRVEWTLEARTLLHDFATRTDREMIDRQNSGTARLWERAYENALRVASLVAVSYNMEHPTITEPMADWAINFVLHSLWSVERRFDTGAIGEGDASQLAKVREIIEKYRNAEFKDIKNAAAKQNAHANGMISYSYLQNKTQHSAAFAKDRRGSTEALKRVLASMVDMGELQRIDPKTLALFNLGNALHYGIFTITEP